MRETADVVIIGGGVMGCSILYHLAKRGVTRSLCWRGTFWAQAPPAVPTPSAGCTTPIR